MNKLKNTQTLPEIIAITGMKDHGPSDGEGSTNNTNGIVFTPYTYDMKDVYETPQMESNAASILGRRGGMARSVKKAAQAKENGKKGGRPKKKAIIDIDPDEF